MTGYLEEYSYDPELVIRGWNEMTTTKSDVKVAVSKFHSLSAKMSYLSCLDPNLKMAELSALHCIDKIDAMQKCGASYFDIYSYAQGASSLVEKDIQAYKLSEAGIKHAREDYARISDVYDAKFQSAKINSAPLNFSNSTQQLPAHNRAQLDANSKNADLSSICSRGSKGTFGYKQEVYSGEMRSVLVGTYMADCRKVTNFFPKDVIVFMLERNPSIAGENHSYISNTHIIEKVASHFADQKMPVSVGILGSNVRHVLNTIEKDFGITRNKLADLEPVLEEALNQCHFEELPEKK
jgi:hypothetical protein